MTIQGLFREPPGTILKDQKLPGHPHLFDVYIPNGPINFCMVACHGGNGGKMYLPQAMYITFAANPTSDQVNWQILELFKCIVIVPQGQHCDGTPGPQNPNGVDTVSSANPTGVATWSNYSMWSQADDVEFLKAISAYIVASFGNVARVLAGHSNGGMMTMRMWFEAPGYFNFYCSNSGPCPIYWDTHWVVPSSIKPLYIRHDLKDSVLGINGGVAGAGSHWTDNIWQSQPANYTVAGYAYPTPASYVPTPRALGIIAPMFGDTFDINNYVETPEKLGWKRTWTMADGDLTLDLLSEGEHGLVEQTKAIRKPAFAQWMVWVLSHFGG